VENWSNNLGENRFQLRELQQELRVTQVEFNLDGVIDQERSRIFLKTSAISRLEKARAGTTLSLAAERSNAAIVSLLNPADSMGAGRSFSVFAPGFSFLRGMADSAKVNTTLLVYLTPKADGKFNAQQVCGNHAKSAAPPAGEEYASAARGCYAHGERRLA
jgi:hypothetical protein